MSHPAQFGESCEAIVNHEKECQKAIASSMKKNGAVIKAIFRRLVVFEKDKANWREGPVAAVSVIHRQSVKLMEAAMRAEHECGGIRDLRDEAIVLAAMSINLVKDTKT